MGKRREHSDHELLQIALSDPSGRAKAVRVLGAGENASLEMRCRELLRRLALDFMNEDVASVVSGNPSEELESTMSAIVESDDSRVQTRGLLNAGLWSGYDRVVQSLKSTKVEGDWRAFLRSLSLYRVTGEGAFLEDASEFVLGAQRDGSPIDTAADEILEGSERARLNQLIAVEGGGRIGRRVSVQESAAAILASVRRTKARR